MLLISLLLSDLQTHATEYTSGVGPPDKTKASRTCLTHCATRNSSLVVLYDTRLTSMMDHHTAIYGKPVTKHENELFSLIWCYFVLL